MDLAWTYILAFHFSLRVEPAAAFKLSSSPRRAAHASHSCERRPTRTAIQVEHAAFLGLPHSKLWEAAGALPQIVRLHCGDGKGAPAKDDRPPARMGRLAIIYKLHRARLVHHRDGRARTALLCLEIK